MLQCAFYEKEITPPLGLNLPGYFNFRPSQNVKDRLYAKALVLSDGTEKIALVCIDSCHAFGSFRQKITQRIARYTGIPAEHVVLSANHTHTGIPDLRSNVTAQVEAYLDTMCALAADCVSLADMRLEGCSVTYGTGHVPGIAFVRDYFMKNATPQTNPPLQSPDIDRPVTQADDSLPVLFFQREDGTPLGAVTCFACHQDVVGKQELSGDFSSVMSRELKKAYGADFVSVFLLAPCGNVNQRDVTKPPAPAELYITMGKKLAQEAIRVIAQARPLSGDTVAAAFDTLSIPRLAVPAEVIAQAEHTLQTVIPDKQLHFGADGSAPEQYAYAMAQRLMAFVKGPQVYDVPLQVLRIGDVLLYLFSGEIFCQFGQMVREGSTAQSCIVVSQCNEYIGYVPTRDMFYDTIYESRPGSCRLDREAGYQMVEKLLQLGASLISQDP